MPRKSVHIKGPALRKKKMAKLIECVSQENYRGTRDLLVEVSDMGGRTKPAKKNSGLPKAKRNGTLQHETPSQPMDIDETSWVDSEEIAMPTREIKVRQCNQLFLLDKPHISLSPSTPTLMSLFQKSTLTCAASSILREFR
jgi:hypothetical protein